MARGLQLYLPLSLRQFLLRPPVAAVRGTVGQMRGYQAHQRHYVPERRISWPRPIPMKAMVTSTFTRLTHFCLRSPLKVREFNSTPTLNYDRCFSSGSSCISSGFYLRGATPFRSHNPVLCENSVCAYIPARSVVRYSKLGKRKTVKAVAKRFIRTGSGKLKYWPAGKTHNMLAKSRNKRRQLRKARYANKTQLKTLNKMIAGW